MSTIYQRLPPELRLRVIEKYFENAKFKKRETLTFLTDVTAHAILFVSHELRNKAFPIFLSTSSFKIEEAYLKQRSQNDHHLYMRHIIIHGWENRTSVDTLRHHFPKMQSLQIYYVPDVIINFGDLRAFAACKRPCCEDEFKKLLLNVMFYDDDKSDQCWISSFRGLKNKKALMRDSKFEIELWLTIIFEDQGTYNSLIAAMSSRDFELTLRDSNDFQISLKQKAIDEDADCELVPEERDPGKERPHLWRTLGENMPAPVLPSTTH